ncbi:MAG: CinA family nicotinamide mononucleotide deamidase-related protein [Mucinivorans sp.]
MQNATIITIGDELLIGQVIDTNSAWIGQRLNEIGVNLIERFAIGDENDMIVRTIANAIKISDIVIVTGGLGPTKDDITKAALCSLFGCTMERDEAVYAHVRALVAQRGIEFNHLNQEQADVPQGFTVMHNAVGSAPGLTRTVDGTMLFCLPGVPFEMKELMDKEVLPRVVDGFALDAVLHSTVLVFGLPESELALRIAAWESALPSFLHLAYLPNPRGIRLRLSAYGVSKGDVENVIAQQFTELSRIIPQNIVGYEPTSLEASIAQHLLARGATVSVGESCTGGVIAARFTAMAGASQYFKGGVVAYDNMVKTNVLGVDAALIEEHGAVSGPVVEAMAVGVLKIMDSDYSIATSGIAGPTGGTAEKPVGTVWMAVAWRGGVVSAVRNFGSPREVCVDRAASFVLNELRLKLLSDRGL